MPRLDATGPMGQGAMTGKRKGRCCSNHSLEDSLGTERGTGRRFRMRFLPEDQEGFETRNYRGRGNFAGQGRGKGMGRLNRGKNQ